MAVVEVKVFPLGTDDASISSYVQACYQIAETAVGVKATLTPTATILEGPLDNIWPVVEAMHESPFDRGASRVVTSLTIDDRQDKPLSMDSLLTAVITDDVID